MRVSEEPVCIYFFRENPVFTSLHLRSPVHVVPPRRGRFHPNQFKPTFYLPAIMECRLCFSDLRNNMTAKTICCVFIAGERIIFLENGTEVLYNYNETRCSQKITTKKKLLQNIIWLISSTPNKKYKHNHKNVPLNVRHPLYAIML